jgi:hypothetical protein
MHILGKFCTQTRRVTLLSFYFTERVNGSGVAESLIQTDYWKK